MPNTRFKESIEIDTIMMSRHHMDKLLNRLGQRAFWALHAHLLHAHLRPLLPLLREEAD